MSKKKMRTSTNAEIRKKPVGMRIWNHRGFYLMFLPVLVYVLIVYYWPMLGVRYAFYDYTLRKIEFVGFKHFQALFEDKAFWQAFTNTLVMSVTRLLTAGLNYGSYVAYWLFVEDVIEALEEKDQYSEKIKNEAEAIISTIEKTLENKIIFEENSLESFDQRLGAVLPSRDQVLTTPEILALICEELMI